MEVAANPEAVPLNERFQAAQFLMRELSEHLQQAFLPKLTDLRSASKTADVEEVTDQAMYDKMLAAMQADEFAGKLFETLIRYLVSIEKETGVMLGVRDPDIL